MDNVHCCGPRANVEEFIEHVKARVPVKFAVIHHAGDQGEYEFLKQKRERYLNGTLIRINPKYVEAVAERLGMTNATPAKTPITDEMRPTRRERVSSYRPSDLRVPKQHLHTSLSEP